MIPPMCKICGGAILTYGEVDFNKNCAGAKLQPSMMPRVAYYRCTMCKFLFTSDFDSWARIDFAFHIYNAEYIIVDPEYVGTRAKRNAELITHLIPATTSCLDFGGGDGGKLTRELRAHQFTDVDWCDEFADKSPPPRWFDFISCFEVLEHTPAPVAVVRKIAEHLAPNGVVLFSTHTQPSDFAQTGLDWWYVAPRNGHVSIFSTQALHTLWDQVGFRVVSVTPNRHFAQRK